MGFITKDMVISRVITDYQGTWEVFQQFGMGCSDCMGSLDETIENGARMHRVSLDKLLNDLNSFIAANG
ncbi:MAG: DUF1858 domain-containing protein [Chloroflexi bacterium]|nr:DUF1858 domain-containing protein [Chloroflexota bacterium]